MRKTLIATSALAFAGALAAGQASAADMMSVGVGGYMEQWFGYANRDDDGVDGGFDVQSDSEIYFQGSLESDSGLKFTVHVQLEANNEPGVVDGKPSIDNTEIDESFARMSGEFGTIEIGQRDPIHTRTHYAAAFGAGVGLNAGDTQKWIPGAYLETAGWTIPGDDLGVIYITPRVNGVQVGVSYHPEEGNENAPTGAPTDNDKAVTAAGINFNETIGDMSIKVSLGHANVSQDAMESFDVDRDDDNMHGAHTDAMKAMDNLTKSFEDATYTNAGLSIGMGAFTFSASYATRDDGKYTSKCYAIGDIAVVDADAQGQKAIDPVTGATADDPVMIPCSHPGAVYDGQMTVDATTGAEESAAGAVTAMHKFVEDESGQHDTFAVGIMYTDGPMSVSIGHMSREAENGDERTATMVSAGYKLAPGVDWKTSLFSVEDDTWNKGAGSEGTAFVTGLDIHF